MKKLLFLVVIVTYFNYTTTQRTDKGCCSNEDTMENKLDDGFRSLSNMIWTINSKMDLYHSTETTCAPQETGR